MTVLSAQSIKARVSGFRRPDWRMPEDWQLGIEPFVPEAKQALGLSYGLTAAGYDIRVGKLLHGLESIVMHPGDFKLVATLEHFRIPHDLQVIVHDKSSWARQGIAVQNTVLEPGWHGWLTLELSNHGRDTVRILKGQPIAQLVFHQLDEPTCMPYKGKYQAQSSEPTEAILRFDTVPEVMRELNDE